jgi:hypothetical protein
MANKRFDCSKVDDELCQCNHRKSSHYGVVHHLGCTVCNCERYRWVDFLDKDGKKLGSK